MNEKTLKQLRRFLQACHNNKHVGCTTDIPNEDCWIVGIDGASLLYVVDSDNISLYTKDMITAKLLGHCMELLDTNIHHTAKLDELAYEMTKFFRDGEHISLPHEMTENEIEDLINKLKGGK